MRSPAHTLAGNLRWTRSGAVWADWLLSPIPYGFRPEKDKHVVRGLHQALFRALPGESLLQGVCSGLDAGAVVERMIDGVDLSACLDWAAECEATLDTLDAISPGQRSYWLSVPLGASNGLDRLREPMRSAMSNVRDQLALPRAGVPAADLERRLEQACRVAAAIPHLFRPRPATAAQMLWLHLHAQQRGALLDLDVPDAASSADLSGQLLTLRAGMTLPEPMLDEGGQSDLSRTDRRAWNPLDRRYLKVTQPGRPDLPAASYQALMVLTDVPSQGMVFPGSEFLGRIDESGLEVDWAIRLQVLGSHDATLKNRKALVNLNEQYGQREGEQSHGLNTLDRAASELAEYAAVLDGDKFEVEVQPTMIFAVAGPDPKSAADQARALTGYFADAGYKLSQPLGYQEELWWAMQPGVPTNRAVREFAQITTSKALAAAVPLASIELGDDRGSLLGLNISSGRPGVALHDMEGAAVRDVSGSVAVVGELGAGKAVAVDTPIATPNGWARMGDLVAGDQVFDEQGRPTVVLGASPVMNGHTVYAVTFSDGSKVVADAEHLWTMIPDAVRVGPAKHNYKVRQRGGHDLIDLAERTAALTGPQWPSYGSTLTTEQVRDTLRSRGQATGPVNHAIPTTSALQLPAADLPIDPYVLGAWLGDGSSQQVEFACADPEILTFIEAAGYTVTKLKATYLYALGLPQEPPLALETHPCAHCARSFVRTYAHRRYCSKACAGAARRAGAPLLVRGVCQVCPLELRASSTGRRCNTCRHEATLTGRLRLLGVLRDKHVPAGYLRSSIAQRQALLAGLLDTEGTVAPQGTVVFDNTNRQLAVDVHELACSLGYRATLREGRARLHGRTIGPKWSVSFTTTDPVFRLPRKQQAQATRTARSSPARTRFRYVVDVTEVPSMPVRCVRVASPSRLFLAGRAMIPTHNSLTLKSLAGDVVDRGGRVVAVDRTQMGEYARWASSVTRATVVDAADPKFSLDPLRLFGLTIGSRVTQTFLTPLLNVAPTSERGVLLSDVLDPAYLDKHAVSSLGGLLAHLADRGPAGCQLPGAAELARVMNVFARRDFGRVVFDPDLPVLQPDAPAVVIRTHTLELPSREELEHEHLFTQMGLEKLFGRALYALVAALARQVCFADPGRLGVFLVDEAHHVTASPEGEREIAVFSRDGRKHKAAMLLGTHDPEEDLGTPTLRGLIPTRILMRHRDKTLAKRGLAYLGLDPDDDELVQMLTEDTSPVTAKGVEEHRRGEAFLRDSSGNIGRIKVLAPALPERNAAVRTSPPETAPIAAAERLA